ECRKVTDFGMLRHPNALQETIARDTMQHAETIDQPRPDWFIVGWFTILHLLAIIGPFFHSSWGAVLTGIALYYVTGLLGITLGYHRLLAHRSFKAPKWVERALATLGVLALQRSPMEWVSHHRRHHAGVDSAEDP